MRKRIGFTLFALLLMASFAHAQETSTDKTWWVSGAGYLWSDGLVHSIPQPQTPTPPPSSPVQHFTLSGSAIGFIGPGGSTPASLVKGALQLTRTVSIGYSQITVPTVASYRLGVADYKQPVSTYLGKKLTRKFVFDISKVDLTLEVGAGKVDQGNVNLSRIAWTAGAFLSYPLSDNISYQVIGAQWLQGGFQGTSGLLTQPASSSIPALSTGVVIHF